MLYKKQFTSKQVLKQIFLAGKIKKTEFTAEKPADDEIKEGNNPVLLQKKKGRDFIILNITDIHYSDYDIRLPMSMVAAHTIKKLVKDVKPDLITVTGDTVCGKSGYFSLMRFIDMMESFSVPWAPIFGNHDDETNCDKFYQAREMMKAPHCLMQMGNPDFGCGNYCVCIKDENETVEALIMTDSKGGQMKDNLREWVIEKGKSLDAKETAVMMHIPLPEYQAAYDEAWDKDKKCWNDGFEAKGEQHEKICCQRDKEGNPCYKGTLEKLKEIPSLKHIICGHEHLNDWSILYNGIRLTYTLKVGEGSGHRKEFDGGTVITIGDNGIKSIVNRTKSRGGFVELN